MRSVAQTDEKQVQGQSGFEVRTLDGIDYPIYLEKKLEGIWENATIDVAGWAAFKRLVLV